MKEFFDQLKSITDVINLGRLVFYTAAGALVVVPLVMLVRVTTVLQVKATFTEQIVDDLKYFASDDVSGYLLFSVCFVVGFLIAATGFLALQGPGRTLAAEVRRTVSDRTYSVTYNYPMLRQNKNEDYANWLVGEYYRFVEIVTYIPIGAMLGLGLAVVYTMVFLARSDPPGFTTVHAALLAGVVSIIFVRGYVWPEVWMKRVVLPQIEAYLTAKRNLIDGLKVASKEVTMADTSDRT